MWTDATPSSWRDVPILRGNLNDNPTAIIQSGRSQRLSKALMLIPFWDFSIVGQVSWLLDYDLSVVKGLLPKIVFLLANTVYKDMVLPPDTLPSG